MKTGCADEENKGGARRKLLKLKIPGKIWKNQRHQVDSHNAVEVLDLEETQQQEEMLEEASRCLNSREEMLFCQEDHSEEDEDQLQRDLEALRLKIWMAIHHTFTSPSSSRELEVLQSAVASIQLQEAQDQRWASCPEDQVPVWRPQKCLSTHNTLLHKMVESRMKSAAENNTGGTEGLSSPLKREVCRMGKRLKEDLLTVERTVKACYPAEWDILNLYAGLYQWSFSTRLSELAASGLETDDCSYLLFWTNHYYPNEVLKNEELEGKIKTACLGSLLPQEILNQLEEQYLTHTEDKVKQWLCTALKKEEENWISGTKPEIIDHYYFSPLALDVIQVLDSPLFEFRCVIRDQAKVNRITAHLATFLTSYKKLVEDFMKGKHSNIQSVIKAQLVCLDQFSDYITGQRGSLSEQQRHHCLETVSSLRDSAYRYFITPIQNQLKVFYRQLWTNVWLDGSLPVVDSMLIHLDQRMTDFSDLKPTCREVLLSLVHHDIILQYIKRMIKTSKKTWEQQVGGACRMIEDAEKINSFFVEGFEESSRLGEILGHIAEVLQLQDPQSVQLEMVSLARKYPDLSDAHVLALLALKTGLSAADIRSIRASVEENRHLDSSANHSLPFFSKIKNVLGAGSSWGISLKS